MLHGWGMHGGIWGDTAVRLAEDFEVHIVDLPGHGKSSMIHLPPQREVAVAPSPSGGGWGWGRNVQSLVDELSARFKEPVNVLGWSLGGIIAQHWAAREPEQVTRLVLLASTPCFSARADWLFGVAGDTLQQFAAELERNPAATLRRFLALQVRGSEHERELLATLRKQLFSRGEPDLSALRGGLEILRDADLRAGAPSIRQPTLAIAGQRDKLTPPEAAYYLAQVMPDARVIEVAGAAHAPFLSHTETVVQHIKKFLHE